MHRDLSEAYKLGLVSDFQFPLLGFLLCICVKGVISPRDAGLLSIPFIGIFALHLFQVSHMVGMARLLSIPFIGIFALHLTVTFPAGQVFKLFQFPLLGFLLCIQKGGVCLGKNKIPTFNSLYWDFCFASGRRLCSGCIPRMSFNSLYWDFCFASPAYVYVLA